jgi:hypothetical protein
MSRVARLDAELLDVELLHLFHVSFFEIFKYYQVSFGFTKEDVV